MKNVNWNMFKNIIIVLLLIIIFLQNSCTKKTVVIPQIKGEFKEVKPKEIPSKIQYKYITLKGKTIHLTNPVNDSLVKEYEKAKDSICKLQLYLDAISEREYITEYDTDTLNLKIYAKTQGKLLKQKPSYIIKPRKVDVDTPVKESKFAMYLGLEVFDNKQFNNFGMKSSIGIQTNNKNILNISYDTNKNFYLGYSVKMFDIKK